MVNAESAPLGHGIVLWFEVDDFQQAVAKAKKLKVEVVLEPFINEGPQHWEIWLKDLDGYTVVLSGLDGEINF